MTTTEIIDALIVQAEKHREADEYTKNNYEVYDDDGGKWLGGCSVGCSIYDLQQMGVLPASTYRGDHEMLAAKTGISEQLWRLNDRIFESLPDTSSRVRWPERFLRAARGRDLSLAWPRFATWLLSSENSPIHNSSQNNLVQEYATRIALLYQEWVETGKKPSKKRFDEAADATNTAYAATNVAYTAYAATNVAYAAYAAYTAAYAASNAIYAAYAASNAAYAAYATVWDTISDAVINSMEACPLLNDRDE